LFRKRKKRLDGIIRGYQLQDKLTKDLKSFSEAIAQEFKANNIPAKGLKPIEESVKELGKEVRHKG
jgi:hypothetical protein